MAIAAKQITRVNPENVLVQNDHFQLIAENDTLTVLLHGPYDDARDAFLFLPVAYIEIPGESQPILPFEQERGVFARFRLSHPLLFDRFHGTLWVQCMDEQIPLDLSTLSC